MAYKLLYSIYITQYKQDNAMRSFSQSLKSTVSHTNTSKCITFLILACYLSGCGTFLARVKSPIGTEYVATRCSAMGLIGIPALAVTEKQPLLLSFMPLFIVDTGVSVATDTILLPIDLAKPNHPNYKSSRPCGFGSLGGGIT